MRIKQSFLLVILLCAMVQGAKADVTYTATSGTAGKTNENYGKLVDGDINSKWCILNVSSPANIYIEFQSSEPIVPKKYILTTGNDAQSYPGRNPKNWVLKAKAKQDDSWTVLATVTDDTKLKDVNKNSFFFPLDNDNDKEYQYFRFEVSAIQNGSVFQLAELKLLTSSLYFQATDGTVGKQASEDFDKLMDGEINSKWCIRDVASPANIYIEFQSSVPIVPKKYILTTGNDAQSYSGRNPKNWVLKARANETDSWTVLATVTDDTKLQDVNKTSFLFPLDNDDKEYQYFRFEVSAIQDGNIFQLAELKLLTSSLYFQATGGTVGKQASEDFDKLMDGKNNTKWYVVDEKAESAYVEFLASEPITPTGYVLTTANDTEKYPKRNPKNWVLKAKLNAGDEWGTLATVTSDNKLQASNYTNFVYSLNKPSKKFQYFRFEVTPDEGKTGLEIQLAELKLLTTAFLEATEGTAGNSKKEGYDRLFDLDKNAKWCVTTLGNPTYVEFQSSEAIVPLGYTLTTCNDTYEFPQRNPKNWKLMAKRYDTDSEWTDLSTVTNDNIIGNENGADYVFGVDNADKKAYQFFCLNVSDVQDGSEFQLAELKMLTADDTPNTSAVVVLDAADNATVLAGGGSKSDVILLGRKLYKDGYWNTLCLPFSLDAFTGTPLAGADVRALESSSITGTTLTMNFSESSLTAIEAGKPYLVKWADPDKNIDDIISPAFNNVTINNTITTTTTDCVDFVGTFSPVTLTANMEGVMVLGAGNTLNYPKAGTIIKSCRAYFVVKNEAASARSFVLNFGDDESAGIRSVAAAHDDRWYSLDGRRLNAKPSQKGIYINNGKILVIK